MSAAPVAVLERALGPVLVDDALQILDERQQSKLALMAEEIESIGRRVLGRPLESQAESNALAELRASWKAASKELELLRKSLVGPLNEQVKAINNVFAKVSRPGEEFDRGAEQSLLAWMRAEADRARREQEKRDREAAEAAERQAAAEAAAAAATTDKERVLAAARAEAENVNLQAIESAPVRPAVTTQRTDSGTTFKRTRKVVVIANAELIPREWLCPDVRRIEKAALAGVVIPGVSVEEIEGLAVRNA